MSRIQQQPDQTDESPAPLHAMRGVRRNAVVNIAGNIIPMLAAVAAMPMLLHGMGPARMGIFTLALGLFGFAGIFDLGLGRALTRSVAHYAQLGTAYRRIAPLLRSGLLAVLALGVIWAVVISLASGWLLGHVLALDAAMREETRAGLLILAVMIPVALLSTSLMGALEGLQLFWRSNAVRIPLGVATYLVPGLVALWYPSLDVVIGSLAAVRVAGLVALLVVVARQIPLGARRDADPLPTAPMWRYTGWLTVSNIVGPLMVYGDRYYLAGLLPPAAVGYYTVPLDTMFRATSLPGAALNAAFPALTRAQARPDDAARFLADAYTMLLFAWVVPLVVVGALLPDALNLWLGATSAEHMIGTSRIILAGVLVNGFALVPFTLLQAIGRTDLTARLHLVELPLFVITLTTLVASFGAVGASMAWALRITFDGLFLFLMARRLFPLLSRQLAILAMAAGGAAAFILASGLLPSSWIRLAVATLVLLLAVGELKRRGGFSWLLSLARAYR